MTGHRVVQGRTPLSVIHDNIVPGIILTANFARWSSSSRVPRVAVYCGPDHAAMAPYLGVTHMTLNEL